DADLAKDHMVYAVFSTGHKSGGFNDNVVINNAMGMPVGSVAPTYKPESVYSLEIGSKNEFLNRAIVFNASAFWYSYLALQVQWIQQIAPPTGATQGTEAAAAVRFNAASSRVLGLELESSARLPAGFIAKVAALIMDARFTDGTIADTRK